MAKHRKSNTAIVPQKDMSAARRRGAPQSPSASNGVPPGTREIDASSALEKPAFEPRGKMTVSRAIAMTGIAISGVLPAVISWGVVMGLIFGGCCSNVFALEAIVKEESESGLLITFVQFLVVALFTMPQHLSISRAPFFLKSRAVPLTRWIPITLMFFTVNMMNNYAFGYNISVPVHIILRSGGSVTTMFVGFLWGKRYTRGQVLGVVMLTVGVIVAAMADAQSKGKLDSQGKADDSTSSFAQGLAILFFAQLLSAIMGIFVQDTYATYGPHWHENLFYSHILSLPLFAPFFPSLWAQFNKLMDSPSFTLVMPNPDISSMNMSQSESKWTDFLTTVSSSKPEPLFSLSIPFHILMLGVNSLTQFACIRGVNLLGARTSALGVTVVLNLRKLVSLFASIWLFGNQLPFGVIAGAAIVFSGAAVYSSGGSKPKRQPGAQEANGKAKTG